MWRGGEGIGSGDMLFIIYVRCMRACVCRAGQGLAWGICFFGRGTICIPTWKGRNMSLEREFALRRGGGFEAYAMSKALTNY